ncbi:MAG: DNA repair exonuclease, partial [Nitrosopumilus sp.]
MKFAHLSDVHLGFQKHESLQKIEQQVFEKAMDECISRKVDFILIPGDMFHVNIPEMRVQKFAFAKFRAVHDAGIPIYVVYGSHDFSPVSNSVIDLLSEVGYITK